MNAINREDVDEHPPPVLAASSTMTDAELVRGIRNGQGACFEIVMRRYNQRLFRAARAIVRDDDEAEDVLQQAYVNAYLHLDQFEQRAQFSTWLTRIVIHEALGRARKAGRMQQLDDASGENSMMDRVRSPERDPEEQVYRGELAALVERAVTNLPDTFRGVFMLREVEGLSTEETAECLGLNEATVKTRLHRARLLLRRELTTDVGPSASMAFQFKGHRCDRLVRAVAARLAGLGLIIEQPGA
ncbi:MAG: RNA polymerase sigma factor [Acidobacteria bacterium]|nr:RNA polymerase sigma factor [Acidobacteriota bacterium]